MCAMIATLLAMILAMIANSGEAQELNRIRGTVEKVECKKCPKEGICPQSVAVAECPCQQGICPQTVLWVRTRDGANVLVEVTGNAMITGIAKARLDDIKLNTYAGVTAMPQPDGTQKALEVHIFPELRRGAGEGHRSWDLVPQSTMTNANVERLVTSVDGPLLTMKYKDGEKKITVPNNVPITTFVDGDLDDLKPGANIFVGGGIKRPDGTFEARGVNVGKNGLVPPM